MMVEHTWIPTPDMDMKDGPSYVTEACICQKLLKSLSHPWISIGSLH
jgi:hypothetical protein